MKTKEKKNRKRFIPAILIGFALLTAIMVAPAAAKTIYVNETGWWIDPAQFNASSCPVDSAIEDNPYLEDGDTVFVYNGTYEVTSADNDPLAIQKSITLKGEGAGVVTFDLSYDITGEKWRISAGTGANGAVIEGLKIVNSDRGVSPVADCIIRNCVFEGITYQYGIPISAQNITFRDNVVTGATGAYGAVQLCGESCTIVNNTIIGNTGAGILLYPSTGANNTIRKNNISSNGKGFFLFNAGEGNKIYLNDVINTPNVAYGGTAPTLTYWNSTEEIEYVYDSYEGENYLGNYWSDYGGTDADGDGIGDTVYDIPGSGTDKDYHPLMAGFENYPAPGPTCGCVGATQTFTCGETVTESCVFNCDMSCPTGDGLVVGGDDIVIDGAGYTIDGVSPSECVLDRAGIYGITWDIRDNVTIKSLKVKNFCSGIFLSGLLDGTKVTNVTIDNCTIYDNGVNAAERKTHGIKMIRVHDSTIENCRIYNNTGGTGCTPPCENGGNGIFLKVGNDNIITNNEIYDNKKGGFFCKASPKRCELSHNEVWGNHQGGIIVRCKCSQNLTIEYNNASCNYGTGIFIGGPCNTIRHNNVSNNKNGSIETLPDTGHNGCGVNFGRSDADVPCGPGGSCGSRYNSLINNTICDNEYLDIWECKAEEMEPPVRGTNNGVENKCDAPDGWNDDGVTGCTYSCTAPAGICGDVNEDEDVDMLDVIDVLYYVSYPGDYTLGSAWAADVNCDTKIDMLDVIDVLYYVSYPGEYELGCCET